MVSADTEWLGAKVVRSWESAEGAGVPKVGVALGPKSSGGLEPDAEPNSLVLMALELQPHAFPFVLGEPIPCLMMR